MPVAKTNGAIIPAEVNPATVAEPTATRIAAAISQPSNNGGSASPLSISANALLIPPSAKTYFNAPAPATINTSMSISFNASVYVFIIETMDVPRDKPMDQVAKSKQINMSIEGSEKKANTPISGMGIVYIKGNSEVIIKMNTGSRAVITLVEKEGSFDSSISRGINVVLGVHAMCLTVLSFAFNEQIYIRVVNTIGSLVWILYGIVLKQNPIILVNTFVIMFHIYWYIKWQKKLKLKNP